MVHLKEISCKFTCSSSSDVSFHVELVDMPSSFLKTPAEESLYDIQVAYILSKTQDLIKRRGESISEFHRTSLLLANFQEGDVSNEGIEHNSPNKSDKVIFSGYLFLAKHHLNLFLTKMNIF